MKCKIMKEKLKNEFQPKVQAKASTAKSRYVQY